MKKFLLTALVLACTTVYADNGKHNESKYTNQQANSQATSNSVAGSQSTAGAASNSSSGAIAAGGQATSGSVATGGTSTSGVTATVGQSLSTANATTGASTSSANGGNATGGNATGGSATGGQGGSATGGQGGQGGTGGVSSSTSQGGTSYGGTTTSSSQSSGGQGGSSSASAGSSTSGVANNVTVGCVDNCGSNNPDRIAADKEIAAGHDQAARDVANSNIKNTPSMFGPALVSSNDTCMGSTSGSLATPGLGLSFGSTWVDDNCKMLKNSQALWNMGFKAASVALMCNDEKIKTALELTGYTCPIKKAD